MKQIELINLTLDEIRRSATMINDVQREAIFSNIQEKNELFENLINECENTLKTARTCLREILENIAEFQNAKDMICGVDEALTKVSYDLIYDRKDEDDFD